MRRCGLLACWLTLGAVARVLAQEPQGFEAGVLGVGALATPSFFGAGLIGALRPGGRLRLSINVLPGSQDDRFALRCEGVVHFLVSPTRRHGLGLYGVGGLAALLGSRDAGYVMLGLGAETAPGGRSGLMIEAGVGGGARIAVGWRHRWLRVPGR